MCSRPAYDFNSKNYSVINYWNALDCKGKTENVFRNFKDTVYIVTSYLNQTNCILSLKNNKLSTQF